MFAKYLIAEDKTLYEALVAINSIGNNDPLTLFVLSGNDVVIGSLTDGDIRRCIIDGASLTTIIQQVAHRPFVYLREGVNDVKVIQSARNNGIQLIPVLNGKMQIVDVVNLKKKKSLLPFDAVLMAGGKGERLRPLTEHTPKPLLKIGDKSIIDHNVDRLISYGIKHISVTVNYLKEQLEEHYKEPRQDIQIQTVREPKYLGTIGSVRFVNYFHNDTVLVMNSDLFTNIDYEDFYLHFKDHDADMSVAAVPYSVNIPYGILDIAERRIIRGLIEKPTYDYFANAGIYLIKRSVIEEIPEGAFFNATDLIEKLISENKIVIRYPLNGTWIDIGNPQEYKRANELIKHM